MLFLSPHRLAGPGYIILNVLRAMNITGLLAVIAAGVVMLAKLEKGTNFFFFDAVSHVVTIFISVFLIISEASLFRSYFARHWPLLSPAHGFVALGLALLALGVNVLGCLNQKAHQSDNLGLAFWRIVFGAGILVLILGIFNIMASYIFQDKETNTTARQIRAKGAVALNSSYTGKAYSFKTAYSSSTGPSRANTTYSVKNPYATPNTAAYTPATSPSETEGKARQPNRFARFARDILPTHHAGRPRPPSSRYSDHGEEREMQISGPLNVNPQFAHLVRPDSTYHPSRVQHEHC